MNIRVAIVEDEKDILEGLKAMINYSPDLEFVGAFEDAESFLDKLPKLKAHVVLMDLNLPGLNGIEGIEMAKEKFPEINFLVSTCLDDDEKIYDALCAGATGYLLKNTTASELEKAIKDIYSGGTPMSPMVARKIIQGFVERKKNLKLFNSLTSREKDVLNLLNKGYAYKMIADKMNLDIETIRFHIKNIYQKLHVHSRTDAINKVFLR